MLVLRVPLPILVGPPPNVMYECARVTAEWFQGKPQWEALAQSHYDSLDVTKQQARGTSIAAFVRSGLSSPPSLALFSYSWWGT